MSFDSGCGHGPNLEVTGWKQLPLPMILLPSTEPHEHGCDVLNMIIFPYALELMPPGWLHHILGLILNPCDDTHQRRLCLPHQFCITVVCCKHNGGADFNSQTAVNSQTHSFFPPVDSGGQSISLLFNKRTGVKAAAGV